MKREHYKQKPSLLLVRNLQLPLAATQHDIKELATECRRASSQATLNGHFVMLCSRFESMIREILVYFLKNNVEKLPTKELKVSRDVLTEGEGFHLMEKIISSHLDLLAFKDLGDLFFRVLEIRRPSVDHINDIIEMKNKRNRIVHDRFALDYKHGWIVNSEGNSIDLTYFETSVNVISRFIAEIAREVTLKYRDYTRLRLFSDLWEFTFITPLCENIEDYWTFDYENDRIIGMKTPSQEASLSGSEKFLLDIWRGQFNNHEVKFSNMASLGNHAQMCLYLFLKVSNDVFMY